MNPVIYILLFACLGMLMSSAGCGMPSNPTVSDAPGMSGAPVFIRIFKQEKVLELWVEQLGRWKLHKQYPVCHFSGELGPKMAEGDGQAPEGFYRVTKSQLNPNSRYHLSFNLGYPNAYERAQGWTGSHLMVHGDCVSVGCYAMTDPLIEEIYGAVAAALAKGQKAVPVHCFPFRMEAGVMETLSETLPHRAFWGNLAEGYAMFEEAGKVPEVSVRDSLYVFNVSQETK
jgi:murein L,D-transpeptidase YafK